jgi:glycosyltransferase involved in cell wall biosynthesis
MRILLTADPYVPVPPQYYGGIERIVAGLIRRLREQGHEVGLVAHPASTEPVDYFLGWHCDKPLGFQAHTRNALCLLRAFRDFQPALVHSFSRLFYLSGLLQRQTPKVMSYQRFVAKHTVRLAALLAGRSLTFTGCSEFISDMGGAHAGTWHAIPNFVETDAYSFSLAVSPDAPLVFLSRVEPIKGVHFAIEVAKKTGRRLIIAGNHSASGCVNGYWENVIEPQIGKQGIEYVGPVDEFAKIRLLNSAAAMIVPIQWDEPFGIVFAEALACGTPVISCPRGALPEIVRNGIDGFLVNNVEEACRAVNNINQIDRGTCRLRAETSFSARVISGRYEALYRSLIAIA